MLLATVLATVYFNMPLPKIIDDIKSNVFDASKLEDLINCTLIYHLFSILVAGSDWYPLCPWRCICIATHFRSWIGFYIALRCCLGGHPWILVVLAGCFTWILVELTDRFYDYLDGYWCCFQEDNEMVVDAFSPGTSSYSALSDSVRSSCREDSKLFTDAPPAGTDVHSAVRQSAESADGEDNHLVPDALLPGTDAYRVLLDSVQSACLKDTGWIIRTYKTNLESVKSVYQGALEQTKEDAICYVKGGSRSRIHPVNRYQQRHFLHCRNHEANLKRINRSQCRAHTRQNRKPKRGYRRIKRPQKRSRGQERDQRSTNSY